MHTTILFIVISIILMTSFMFYILKKTIKKMEEQSKTYFIDNLSEYDDLLEKKESEVRVLNNLLTKLQNEEIPNEKKEKYNINDFSVDSIKVPSLSNNDIFDTIKALQNKFKIDEKKVIKEFIKNHPISKEDYNKYINIKNTLNYFEFEELYKITNLSLEDQIAYLQKKFNSFQQKILSDYLRNEIFSIDGFLLYLQNLVEKFDPYIYILIGNERIDYSTFSKRIRMKYKKEICYGFAIMYQQKLYDYSIG